MVKYFAPELILKINFANFPTWFILATAWKKQIFEISRTMILPVVGKQTLI